MAPASPLLHHSPPTPTQRKKTKRLELVPSSLMYYISLPFSLQLPLSLSLPSLLHLSPFLPASLPPIFLDPDQDNYSGTELPLLSLSHTLLYTTLSIPYPTLPYPTLFIPSHPIPSHTPLYSTSFSECIINCPSEPSIHLCIHPNNPFVQSIHQSVQSETGESHLVRDMNGLAGSVGYCGLLGGFSRVNGMGWDGMVD